MNNSLQRYAPLITSLFTLIIYLLTMSRGIMPIDAGELATSQYTLGISHPSGYPLFNILGFLWSKIPIGTVIFRLNLLCAIWVALANFFLVKTAFLILKNAFVPKPPVKKPTTKNATNAPSPQPKSLMLELIASISGILVLAFCRTWWIQSAGVEVYSLHIALLAVFFFVFLKTYYKSTPTFKDWIICGIFLGLCFTNHLTSFLILPGVVVLYFMKMKFTGPAFKSGLVMAAAFTGIFLLLYGFMMIRAGASPKVNWGDPENMEYMKRHVSGWQFQTFMGDDKKSNDTISTFFSNLSNESMIFGIILMLAGMIYGFMKNAKMSVFWAFHFLSCLLFAAQYSIHDIENYFLLAYMSAAIFMVFGVYWLLTSIKSLQKNVKPAWAMLILPLVPLALYYPKVDQSKIHYVDQYSISALNSVEKDAIILSWEWDVFISPCLYHQFIDHQRPDVLIIDKELLRRSWYFKQVKVWDPGFATKVEKQSNEFNEAVIPFERKQKHDPNFIQGKFEALIGAILNEYKNRPVYVSSLILDANISRGVDVKLPPNTLLVPDAYFYRLVPADTSKYYPLTNPLEFDINFTPDSKEDKFQRQILNFSMSVLSSRVGYEMYFKKMEEARKIFQLIQSVAPETPVPEGLYEK